MFDNLGWSEIAVLAILGLLIFGPERLPKVAADAGRLLRELRRMASGMTEDLRTQLGPELDELRSLDPRRALRDEPAAAGLPAGERPPYDADAT